MRAQYTAGTVGGEDASGYLQEEGVPAGSHTETYAALKLEVHNWRWAGVPIFLRTGKRLARKVTEIAVQLKPVPHLAFQSEGSVGVQPNQLILTVQPNEGVSLSLGAKIPGSKMRIRPVNMEFLYGSAFMSQSPEAYERLILDAMRGDATLFTRNDEVDAQWSIIDPILQAWHAADGSGLPTLRGGHRRAGGGRRRCSATGAGARCERGRLERARHVAQRDRGGAAHLLSRRYQEDRTFVPARVMNLVVIVDRAFRGEVENRLARVGRYHPSRLVIVAVEEGRTQIDAWATVAAEDAVHKPGHIAVGRERVEVDVGPQLLDSLDTIVDPLLVSDLTTMVWAPHGHAEGVDALRRLANIVLVDTQDEPEPRLRLRARRRPHALAPTWSTSRGCARRRGASGSRRRSTRRRCAPRCTRSSRSTVRHRAGLDRRGRALLRLAELAAGLAAGGARAQGRRRSPGTPARAAARWRSSCGPEDDGLARASAA